MTSDEWNGLIASPEDTPEEMRACIARLKEALHGNVKKYVGGWGYCWCDFSNENQRHDRICLMSTLAMRKSK